MCCSVYVDGEIIDTLNEFKARWPVGEDDYYDAEDVEAGNVCLCVINVDMVLDNYTVPYKLMDTGDIIIYSNGVVKDDGPILQWDDDLGLWISCCYQCKNGPIDGMNSPIYGLCTICWAEEQDKLLLESIDEEAYNLGMDAIAAKIAGEKYAKTLVMVILNMAIEHKEEFLEAISLAVEYDK